MKDSLPSSPSNHPSNTMQNNFVNGTSDKIPTSRSIQSPKQKTNRRGRLPKHPINGQIGSSLNINSSTPPSIINPPCSTCCSLQQSTAMDMDRTKQQLRTYIGQCPSTMDISDKPQQIQNDVDTNSGLNNDNYTLVGRSKQKKVKLNPTPTMTSAPVTLTPQSSTPSTDTNNPTSTNTSIIDSYTTAAGNHRTLLKQGDHVATGEMGPKSEISQQARTFAQTRYPYPPFIIKFDQVVDEKMILQAVSNHFTTIHNFKLNLAGHRLRNRLQLLVFVGNRDSFLMLYDEQKWPTSINGMDYNITRPGHLPPQFSVMLKNVPANIEIDELLADIEGDYPEIIDAHRVLNKNKQVTTLVRVDTKSVSVIDELVGKKFIYLQNLRVSVTEYLAPAKVLVCTKCFLIGHFRSRCTSKMEYCRTCGEGVDDINKHKDVCNKKVCCIRCKGPHESNDGRCPDIKSFRSILTKSLLDPTEISKHQQQSQSGRINNSQRDNDIPTLNYNYTNCNATLRVGTDSNPDVTSKRIEELLVKINKLDENLNRVIDISNNYCDKLASIQAVVGNNEHALQVQKADIAFQCGFVSQFISPICQVMVEVLPSLVNQNIIKNNTLLCSSVTELCSKLNGEVGTWKNRFAQTEDFKMKLICDYNLKNQHTLNSYSNNNTCSSTSLPPSVNQ